MVIAIPNSPCISPCDLIAGMPKSEDMTSLPQRHADIVAEGTEEDIDHIL